MPVKLVRQKKHYGCGAACLAMATGKTYDWALKQLPSLDENGLSCVALVKALRKAGFKVKERYFVTKIKRLKKLSILLIWEKDCGHFVVWDPNQQKIIDPQPPTFRFHFYEKYLDAAFELEKK